MNARIPPLEAHVAGWTGARADFLEQACPWVARNHLRRSHCRAVIDHDDLEQVAVQALRIQAAETGFD